MLVYHGRVSRRVVLGLVVLTGCDVVFGLNRDGTGQADDIDQGDAGLDGGMDARPCKDRSPVPQFCFDFDGKELVGYQTGTEFTVTPDTLGVNAAVRGPAVTGANAMWFMSTSQGHGIIDREDGARSFHAISAVLFLRGTAPGTASGAVPLVSILVGNSCGGQLEVDPMSLALQYTISCNGTSGTTGLGQLADAWSRVTLTFDRATGQGTASNGAPGHTITIAPPGGNGAPRIRLGLLDVGLGGVVAAFDDVEVTVK